MTRISLWARLRFTTQPASRNTTAIRREPMERGLQMELVDPAHHRQIVRARRDWLIINGRARDFQQTALRGDRQNRVIMVYQREPFGTVHGPDLLRKKSRSTVSCPIFSYKGASRASSAVASPFAPPLLRTNSDAVPSSSAFFHAWI
jgi:hypothetical protein